jgi:hypothetical protein
MSLLSEAVEKYGIPPWPYEAAFDRVVVFSVPEVSAARDTYIDGGLIAKPESRRSYDQDVSPRGIIVSAGLVARDELRAHGMDLGHMVWVARLSPWRHQVDRDSNGKAIEFLFLRTADIVGSETLLAQLGAGTASYEKVQHILVNGVEAPVPRADPPSFVA